MDAFRFFNESPVGVSKRRSPFSEETRRFWLSGRLMVLDILKKDEGCSPFEGPFWCCRSLRFGKSQPHFASVPGVHRLGAVQLPEETRRVLALLIKVPHALVFAAPARGAQCLTERPGHPESLLQPFGLRFCLKPSRDAEAPRGWALGRGLRATAQQTGWLQGGCFGLRSIYLGDIRFEPPASVCLNL